MGEADYFALGDYNATCSECGKKRKASQLKRHWKGYLVCEEHWEARHPQDLVRAAPKESQPRWIQPEPTPTFVTEEESGVPDFEPFDPTA
jgi:hypothetical protein